MSVNFSTVWSNLNNDPKFEQNPESVREAAKPHIEALLKELDEHFGNVATLQNYTDARMVCLRYFLNSSYIDDVVNAMPVKSLMGFSIKDLAEMSKGMMESALEMFEPMSKDVAAFLEENGVTEDQVMLNPQVGLRDEARQLYKKHNLTIGKLFELQPMALIDFTGN